jgi:predicted transcriptional regulator
MTIELQHYEEEQMTRTEKMRIAARVLIRRGVAGNGGRWGLQSRLAEHFGVTRQRVSQIVRQEVNSLNSVNTVTPAGSLNADPQ